MTRQVAGFITADGRFFESKQQAEYEEWLMIISDTFEESLYGAMPATMLVNFIEQNVAVVKSFCEAFEAQIPPVELSELELLNKGETYGKDQGSNSIEDADATTADNSGT